MYNFQKKDIKFYNSDIKISYHKILVHILHTLSKGKKYTC
jgi:hypothetical protein